LKLKCDEPLSNFTFEFNLRRYSKVEDYVNWLMQFPAVRERLLTGTATICVHAFTDAAQYLKNRKITCISVRVLCLDGLPQDSAFYDGIVAMYGGGDDRGEQMKHFEKTVYAELQRLELYGIKLNGEPYKFRATHAQDGLSWRGCGGKGTAACSYPSSLWRILASQAAESINELMVGRCRLQVSKPELKARLVSALETEM
jgi:hypothetical protein